MQTTPGIVRLMGSVGNLAGRERHQLVGRPEPHEELAVDERVAGEKVRIRWKYRQMINALVYQAMATDRTWPAATRPRPRR